MNNNSKINANEIAYKKNNEVKLLDDVIKNLESFLNINKFQNITSGNISGGGTLSSTNVTVATNSDGSLAKIYGQVDVANNGHNGNVTLQTNLRPTEQMVIYQNTYRQISLSGYVRNTALISITINTDGTVVIPYVNTGLGSAENCRMTIFGCLLFIKDFGDTPID